MMLTFKHMIYWSTVVTIEPFTQKVQTRRKLAKIVKVSLQIHQGNTCYRNAAPSVHIVSTNSAFPLRYPHPPLFCVFSLSVTKPAFTLSPKVNYSLYIWPLKKETRFKSVIQINNQIQTSKLTLLSPPSLLSVETKLHFIDVKAINSRVESLTKDGEVYEWAALHYEFILIYLYSYNDHPKT